MSEAIFPLQKYAIMVCKGKFYFNLLKWCSTKQREPFHTISLSYTVRCVLKICIWQVANSSLLQSGQICAYASITMSVLTVTKRQ